jgi:hypothetical protein
MEIEKVKVYGFNLMPDEDRAEKSLFDAMRLGRCSRATLTRTAATPVRGDSTQRSGT